VWNKPWKANQEQALAELVLIGVRAAVLAHQDEVGKWFSWPVEWALLAELISRGASTTGSRMAGDPVETTRRAGQWLPELVVEQWRSGA